MLTIPDVSQEDIFGVIGRMESTLNYLQSKKRLNHLTPFLNTYYLVTKKVVAKSIQNKNYFRNQKSLEELDIHFASLFFKPLLIYLTKGTKLKPWQEVFKYDGSIPFLQMLLGINAHVNADLCTTLVDLDYRKRKDFLVINKILDEVIPDVVKCLAFEEKDIISFGGLFFERFVHDEFRRIVVKWRNNAWKNAAVLRKNPSLKKELYIKTELLGKDLKKLFSKILHFENPTSFFKELHKLEVRLS